MDQIDLFINNLTCRICLENYETSNSLFDFVDIEGRLELKDVLNRVTHVEITFNDTYLPTRICHNCTESLLGVYEFVSRVEKSERILRNQLDLDQKYSEDETEMILSDSDKKVEAFGHEFEVLNEEGSSCEKDFEEIRLNIDNFISISPETVSEDNINLNTNSVLLEERKIQSYDNAIGKRSPQQDTRTSRQPIGNNKWLKCEECHRKFARIETLNRHIGLVHSYAPPEHIASVVAKIPKEYTLKQQLQCPHCPRTFARKDNLIRHAQNVHHVKLIQEKDTASKKHHTYKRGLCPYCGESFTQASLVVHIRRHTGETPYICENCNKGFPRRQDLIIHQRKHTGERPHVCTLCGKSFARPNKLTRHMRIHTGERPYKCTECDRSFAQSNDLNIHIRRHTGEKPYKCKICGEAFISGTALRSHSKLKAHALEEITLDPYEKIRVNSRSSILVMKKNEGN